MSKDKIINVADLQEPFLVIFPEMADSKGGHLFYFQFAGNLLVLADFFSNYMQEREGVQYLFQKTNELYNRKMGAKKRKRTIKAKRPDVVQMELF